MIRPTLLAVLKKVSRKTRGALSSSTGGARVDPIGGSQFSADRRPAVSHIMVACLPVGGGDKTVGDSSGAVMSIATAGLAAGRQSGDCKARALLHAGVADGILTPREARDGLHHRAVGGRDLCVAVSGGLASVLELVQPLRHVAWAGRDTGSKGNAAAALHGAVRKREIFRMARVPSTWRRAVAIEELKDADHNNNNDAAAAAAAEADAETVVDDVDGEAEEFMVMCQGGWFGWYRRLHGRFEVSKSLRGARACSTDKASPNASYRSVLVSSV